MLVPMGLLFFIFLVRIFVNALVHSSIVQTIVLAVFLVVVVVPIVLARARVRQKLLTLVLALLLDSLKVRFHKGVQSDNVVTVPGRATRGLGLRAGLLGAETETDQAFRGNFDIFVAVRVGVPLFNGSASLL